MDTFHDHKHADAEKFNNEVINAFTQTELTNSSETEVSTNLSFLDPHGFFRNLGNFAHKPAIHLCSLRCDVDDEFSEKSDTLQVNYASSDYISAYSVTLRRKDPSARMSKFNNNSI